MPVLRVRRSKDQVFIRFMARAEGHEGNTMPTLPVDDPVKPFLVGCCSQMEAAGWQHDPQA